MGASRWRWFGIRTLHRTRVNAPPPRDPEQPTLVEVQVLLVKARTPAEAVRRARRHAGGGAPFRNMLGQQMRRDHLGYAVAYEIFDDEARRLEGARGPVEVFADTHLVLEREPDAAVVQRFIGGPADAHERNLRLRLFVPDDLARRISPTGTAAAPRDAGE